MILKSVFIIAIAVVCSIVAVLGVLSVIGAYEQQQYEKAIQQYDERRAIADAAYEAEILALAEQNALMAEINQLKHDVAMLSDGTPMGDNLALLILTNPELSQQELHDKFNAEETERECAKELNLYYHKQDMIKNNGFMHTLDCDHHK